MSAPRKYPDDVRQIYRHAIAAAESPAELAAVKAARSEMTASPLAPGWEPRRLEFGRDRQPERERFCAGWPQHRAEQLGVWESER